LPAGVVVVQQTFSDQRGIDTLKAFDQEQSLATVHHAIEGSPAALSPPVASALREQRADRGE
jgi:hypothetical protein